MSRPAARVALFVAMSIGSFVGGGRVRTDLESKPRVGLGTAHHTLDHAGMLQLLQWVLIVVQAVSEIGGLTLQRHANSRPGAQLVPQTKRPYWLLGVSLYFASILVYFFALSISALSWLGVVSCSMNILLSSVSAQILGEHISRVDVAVFACTLSSSILAARFEPVGDLLSRLQVGEKILDADRYALGSVFALLLVLVALLVISHYSPQPALAAVATVLGYALASASAQMYAKLVVSFGSACVGGGQPAGELLSLYCPVGAWSPLVFLVPCAACGGIGVLLMLTGVDRYENKFWVPNALAMDLMLTTLIGFLIFGEDQGMNKQDVMGFGLAAALSVLALWLGVLGGDRHACPPLEQTHKGRDLHDQTSLCSKSG